MLGLFSALDDDTLHYLGGGKDMPGNWREVLALLSRPEAMRHPEVAALARDWQSAMAVARTDLEMIVNQLLIDSGAEELLPAFDSGLVTLSESGFTEGTAADTDALLDNWLTLLRGLLVDTRIRLVLDHEVGSLAASLIREGHVNPHSLTMRHAGQAALGSGLVARLPAFPSAPLDEILDLRGDLAAPLARYRSAVVRLADRLQAGPFDKDMPDEIDDLWGTDVQPALDQISDGFHDHGLVREIARSARQDVKTLIAEGSALYVGLAELASVNEWIAC